MPKNNAVWFCGWFPSNINPLAGNFILRHAQAVGEQFPITVVHFALYDIGSPRPKALDIPYPFQLEFKAIPQFSWKFLKPLNWIMYYFLVMLFSLRILQKKSLKIVHIHAADKVGIVAVFFKSIFRYSLYLTEHWAIFNDTIKDRYSKRNLWFRWSFKRVWKNTDWVASISLSMHRSMEQNYNCVRPFLHFPNVLDPVFVGLPIQEFSEPAPFRFLHISNFASRKNVPQIINAFLSLKKEIPHIELWLLGGAQSPDFPANQGIVYFPPRTMPELLPIYQQCQALVMYSSSENAPCVISEAQAFGLPVISSDVGSITEMVNEEQGIVLPFKNEKSHQIADIEQAMRQMCLNYSQFSRKTIQLHAMGCYSPDFAIHSLLNSYQQTCAE
jgi:glycosyltransferase involved in cell wall biosynthesis